MKTKLFLLILFVGANILSGCNDNDEPTINEPDITMPPVGSEWIDPEFAMLLQQKHLITDARSVIPAHVADIQLLNISGTYIDFGSLTSLRGIEYFVSLEYLDCRFNQLTELDLSKNTKLKSVTCQYNQLTQLNVDGCAELYGLQCDCNQLTQLNLSSNTSLERVTCELNQLTRLIVDNNQLLDRLDCSNNNLTQLDLSNSPQLTSLACSSNRLTQLDISNNTLLRDFACDNNPGANGLLRVRAWFDNDNVPSYITDSSHYSSSWEYNGNTINLYYYK